MKQLLILSGKGGTGKTTVASSFVSISNSLYFADCDVDAPNLHIVVHFKDKPERSDFYGLSKAEIDSDQCISCGLCAVHCRFEAIDFKNHYIVHPTSCEGCGVCALVCPVNAIEMKPCVSGEIQLYSDAHRRFSTAQLKIGNGNSGLLVSEVKKRILKKEVEELLIVDGSPGIGCPVIASISGVDLVLIVAEPSISGISDMDRIVKTAGKLQSQVAVCVNKFDINLEKTDEIRTYCQENGIPFTGVIPFDPMAVEAVNEGKSIVELDCPSGLAVHDVFSETLSLLNQINQRKGE